MRRRNIHYLRALAIQAEREIRALEAAGGFARSQRLYVKAPIFTAETELDVAIQRGIDNFELDMNVLDGFNIQ